MKRVASLFFGSGIIGLLLVLVLGCGVKESSFPGGVKLRAKYQNLQEKDVQVMLEKYGFYDKRRNSHRDFANQFQLIETQKTEQYKKNPKTTVERVVLDKTTGLVWLQSGSARSMAWEEAVAWVKELNELGYGGYKTWRIPSLEEAASLLESRKVKNRFINPLFSSMQYSITCGDQADRTHLWGISFQMGQIIRIGLYEPNFLRLVTHLSEKQN